MTTDQTQDLLIKTQRSYKKLTVYSCLVAAFALFVAIYGGREVIKAKDYYAMYQEARIALDNATADSESHTQAYNDSITDLENDLAQCTDQNTNHMQTIDNLSTQLKAAQSQLHFAWFDRDQWEHVSHRARADQRACQVYMSGGDVTSAQAEQW